MPKHFVYVPMLPESRELLQIALVSLQRPEQNGEAPSRLHAQDDLLVSITISKAKVRLGQDQNLQPNKETFQNRNSPGCSHRTFSACTTTFEQFRRHHSPSRSSS